jgi:hypothetical protein
MTFTEVFINQPKFQHRLLTSLREVIISDYFPYCRRISFFDLFAHFAPFHPTSYGQLPPVRYHLCITAEVYETEQ